MLKRFISAVVAGVGLANGLVAGTFAIGAATISPPKGWHLLQREEERLVFRSADDRQQATISWMRFGVAPSFEDFKQLGRQGLGVDLLNFYR